MGTNLRTLAAGVFFCTLWASDTALAQKSGGVLKVYFFDSPASMSIHEEATIAAEGPMMGVTRVSVPRARGDKKLSQMLDITDGFRLTEPAPESMFDLRLGAAVEWAHDPLVSM
jgi:hypothetical protein